MRTTKDSTCDKAYLTTILNSIFEKSNDKKNSGGKELELYVKHKINAYKVEESLESIIGTIKKELLDNNSPFKQYILHGNMKIFEILFYIINSYNVSDKIYFCVLVILLKILNESDNDKSLATSSANTIIKLIKGKRKLCSVYFEHLFESLIFLYLHTDKDVRNYGYALDELLKDEVSNLFLEDYSTTTSNISKSVNSIDIINYNNEQVVKFPIMYLLGKWGENNHPALKILIISWIAFLESISEIKMINYMNKIIPELFNLLCFKTKDVFQSSEYCLKKILCDIESQYESLSCDYPTIMNEILEAIILNCLKLDEKIKSCSFEWLEMFLKKFQTILDNSKIENDDDKKLKEYLYQNTCENNFIKGNIIPQTKFIEVKNIKKEDATNYKILREVIHKNNKLLLKLGLMEKSEKKKKLSMELLINNIPHHLFSGILNVIINNSMYNNKSYILKYVEECNQIFKFIMANYPSKLLEKNLRKIEKVLVSYITKNINEQSVFLVLEWTNQLYNQFESKLFGNEEIYIEKLVNIIPNSNKNILTQIMKTLCLICDKQPEFVDYIINLIIKLFSRKQNLINLYGIKVLKSLSKTIDSFTIFKIFCDNLLKSNDIFFVMKITKILNLFLLSENECQNIRNELSKKKPFSLDIDKNQENIINNKKDYNLFEKLFYLWALNPFMAVLLSMYCNYFELSYYLTLELSKIKLQENDYIELCQIIQIFESSIFNSVRVKLLRPKKNIYLVKTLYALLMILPQTNSFDSLNNRIKSVRFIAKFDDDKDDEDDFYENEKNNEENMTPENKKAIIAKFTNILIDRYKAKISYEKEMKKNKINI